MFPPVHVAMERRVVFDMVAPCIFSYVNGYFYLICIPIFFPTSTYGSNKELHSFFIILQFYHWEKM